MVGGTYTMQDAVGPPAGLYVDGSTPSYDMLYTFSNVVRHMYATPQRWIADSHVAKL